MRMKSSKARYGVAAVEFAFVMPILLTLLLGTWEIGRAIQVQQVMVNAAREGARIAAQGQIINLTGTYTQIKVNTGTPNVKSTVIDYMKGAGFTNTTGMTVTFAFLDGATSSTEPYQGTKNQRYRVTLTVPYDNVRITNLNFLNLTNLTAQVDWVCMADDPFTVDTSIPTWNAIP